MIGELNKLLDNGYAVVLVRHGRDYVAYAQPMGLLGEPPPSVRRVHAAEIESAVKQLPDVAFSPKAMRPRKPPQD